MYPKLNDSLFKQLGVQLMYSVMERIVLAL